MLLLLTILCVGMMFVTFVTNVNLEPVSYTHLDVYKRQASRRERQWRLSLQRKKRSCTD